MFFTAPRRLLITLSALAVLFVGGFLISESWQIHKRGITAVQRDLEAQATLLTEHAQVTLANARQVLIDIEWEQNRQAMQTYLASRPLYQRILGTPQFAGLMVADVTGKAVFTAKKFPMRLVDLKEQDFFQAHLHGAYDAVGHPMILGEASRRVIPVSRRLVDENGTFAGVAVLFLDSDYFQDFYNQVIEERQLRIGMFHQDGTALSLYPAPFAELPSSQQNLSEIFTNRASDTFVIDSPIDGQERIAAYQNLELEPIALTVSYSYDAFLDELEPAFKRNGIIFLFFVGGIVLSTTLLYRALTQATKEREAKTGALRQQQETLQLCQAIAHNLPNGRVTVLDRNYRVVFVEGKVWQDHPDYNTQAMQGRIVGEVLPLEQSRNIEALVNITLAGKEGEEEFSLQEQTYKAFATPLRDSAGHINRCLLLIQDITQLKNDQKALERLNSELERLARTDSLLGISNRRELDTNLEREWQRAMRENQRISILLIDVDFFKRYNDAYGHPAGDVCLQKVASVLSDVIRRPGDLAARYGGEEMAILLPNTELEGALHVAQRVHRLLEERNLPFEASLVSDRVTVSIGVASISPTADQSPHILIEQADQALYAAKGNGRNRTELYRG